MNENIEFLSQYSGDYLPTNTETLKVLSDISLTTLIGPAAVGKSSLVQEVIDLDSEITSSIGFTTRPMRVNENNELYNFVEHTEENIDTIKDQVINGELVQYSVHPTTGYVYGSRLDSYRSKYVLMDVSANSLQQMKRVPFNSLETVGVVCNSDAWLTRFLDRKVNMEDAKNRVIEGISSLELLLDLGGEVNWLDNSSLDIESTARYLIDFIKYENSLNYSDRKTGVQLLKCMKIELANWRSK